jgi:tryptophanyl-tRNA synthetase
LLEDEAHLLSILHEGSRKAREVAAQTIDSTYRNLGIVQ